MEDLARLEQALRQLADQLARLRSQLPKGNVPLPALPLVVPADLQPTLNQLFGSLDQLLDKEGVQVLIAGVHRKPPARVSSWYELFSGAGIEKVLRPEVFRTFESMVSAERLRLLLALQEGFYRSAELMKRSGLSQGQFYHHLRILEGSGMVRKKGRDEYEATVHGISTLFTLLAVASYVLSGIPHLATGEGEKEGR